MRRARLHWLLHIGLGSAVAALGCHREQTHTPPPDARRPVLKSEAELAAERQAQIERGEIVETPAPAIQVADRVPTPRRRPVVPLDPYPGSIEGDILMVDNEVVTAVEVLLPLWPELLALRDSVPTRVFSDRARELIVRETQRQVGRLLVYAEAMRELKDEQRERLEAVVVRRTEDIISREFGGSSARMSEFLARRGLSEEQYRLALQRDMVVQQYTREKLLPKLQLTRSELLAYYEQNINEFSSPATRELRMIELPFAAYLPTGVSWDNASTGLRAQAKMQAMRQARAAHEALQQRPFAEVAQEYSRGLHAAEGGSWGHIGRPLQPPYRDVSQRIFEYTDGQTSEPLEIETGWVIVQCGAIRTATRREFVDVQTEISEELRERRFARLSTDYILDLAEDATISSLDRFVGTTLRRAEAILPTLEDEPG